MRRFLAPVAAVYAACALTAPLWVTALAATGAQAPVLGGGEHGAFVQAERVQGDLAQEQRVQEDLSEKSPGEARSGESRVETEHSSWAYVDRAFPDQTYDGAEPEGVGTGGLEWDRDYTRRALFRFPVETGIGEVVDSATLRTEVTWSYDCGGDAHVQLHRVDPFGTEVTWNDQPTAHTLLDTRNVQGGKPSCPVPDGVEFDVTKAYQWAVDHGRSHLHLRLKERDESGSAGWRRFDVQDSPPVLVVDHSTPPISSETLNGFRYRVADDLGPLIHEPAWGRDLADRDGTEKAVIGPEPFLGGGERIRSEGRKGPSHPRASKNRRRYQSALPRVRGPPA